MRYEIYNSSFARVPADKLKTEVIAMKQNLFSKDFTLVVIGQIISLFGNAAVRFALPLYLLNQTGSSALYGTVMACSFIPAVLLSPIGGVIADRVNKRNIMVILDFFTAAVILTFSLLITVVLMILYGIAGAYQPTVQASIPALVCREHFMAANSVINTVSSFAALTGPVLGGILYSAYGLRAILWISMMCFVLSAVMEIFIRIPHKNESRGEGIIKTVKLDFAESLQFILKKKPAIGKGMFVICGINLFLSAMILVALPYLITEVLNLEAVRANRLYGFAEGAMAAGGLLGGICAGVFAGKLSIRKSAVLLKISAMCVFPMGAVLIASASGIFKYMVITVCCFAIMLFSSVFTVLMMSFIQAEVPQNLIGKVIAVIMTVSMCAQPLGNAWYGVLFEFLKGYEYVVVLFSGVVSLGIAAGAEKVFKEFS